MFKKGQEHQIISHVLSGMTQAWARVVSEPLMLLGLPFLCCGWVPGQALLATRTWEGPHVPELTQQCGWATGEGGQMENLEYLASSGPAC